MEIDAAILEEGATLETDVCVVGAGPAGMVVGSETALRGLDVLVLESGWGEPDRRAAKLARGLTRGDRYARLETTRSRMLGGTARMWNTPVGGAFGAKYAPLQPADLARRVDPGGWPLRWDELERWYLRAQETCGLGAFAYDRETWSQRGAVPPELPTAGVCARVYQLGLARAVTGDLLADLRDSSTATVCTGATVTLLAPGPGGEDIETAEVRTTDGRARLTVRARLFVLAAGAIENARLLLLSRSPSSPEGLGNASGWVGRCFMEHPRDHRLVLVPHEGLDAFRFFDTRPAGDGTTVAGRLALTDDLIAATSLPNASATLVPRMRPPGTSKRRRRRGAYPIQAPGWSLAPASMSGVEAFHLLVNAEQLPRPGNRVTLSRRSDRLGVPRAELTWRWSAEDERALERVCSVLAEALVAAGLGRIEPSGARRPDPRAHHHAGTTRMSDDAALGVVDADGRVHGTENVYVAGASVFPTAGFANPTLTIVALAHRLADHLSHGR